MHQKAANSRLLITMSNNYFQFKQFRVEQGDTAMKVCTDSCIFGACIEAKSQVQSVLDIGTGTGLLSLMLAQRITNRLQVAIDAVEIDKAAYKQATQNINNSPWSSQIKVHHAAIQQYAQNCGQPYDLIISNPPFFENHLKANHTNQNLALHSKSLSFDELLIAIDQLLAAEGTLAILLPVYQMQVFAEKARLKKLYINQQLLVHNNPKKRDFRMICHFSRNNDQKKYAEKELYIRNAQNDYTEAFVNLLKAYYLHL